MLIANSWPILFYARLTYWHNVYNFSNLRIRVKIFISVSLPVKFLALLKVFEGRPILSTGWALRSFLEGLKQWALKQK